MTGGTISRTITASNGKPLTVVVAPGRHAPSSLGPRAAEKDAGVYRLGFILARRGPLAARPRRGSRSRHAARSRRTSSASLGNLVTGQGRKDISSPVGIVQGSSDAAKQGTDSFLWVLGLISLSIALLNLLPLPAARRRPHRLRDRRGDPRPHRRARDLRARLDRRDRARAPAVRDRPHQRHRAAVVSGLHQRAIACRQPDEVRARAGPLHVEPPVSTPPGGSRDSPTDARATSDVGSPTGRRAARPPPAAARSSTSPSSAAFDAPRAAVELRLGGEETAARDAVQPSGEPLAVPRLDRVRPAELVEARVGSDERFVDPAVGPARVGAAADHLRERSVDRISKPRAGAPQRPRRDETDDRDNRSPRRRPPDRARRPPASGRARAGRQRAACRARGRRRHPRRHGDGRRADARACQRGGRGLGGHVSTLDRDGKSRADPRRRRHDRWRRSRRRPVDDTDEDARRRGDDRADRSARLRRLRGRPLRRAEDRGRGRARDDRPLLADPCDRRHPLQRVAGPARDRRRRRRGPDQPGQHRRP